MASTQRRGKKPHPLPVRFSMMDTGVYAVWDCGEQADATKHLSFHFAGEIRSATTNEGTRWQITGKDGKPTGPPHVTLQQAKNWYLTSRGLPAFVPHQLHTESVAIPYRTWERSDEWRAKVFRVLTRNPRNSVPAVDRLLTPVARTENYLHFQWPKELVEDWFHYVNTMH